MLNIHTDIKDKLNTFIEQKKIPNLISVCILSIIRYNNK